MHSEHSTVLVTADITGIVIFFLITFGSWVVSYLNEKKQQEKRMKGAANHGNQPKKQRQRPISEIDQALELELERLKRQAASSSDVVIVAPPPARPRQAPRPQRSALGGQSANHAGSRNQPGRQSGRSGRNPASSQRAPANQSGPSTVVKQATRESVFADSKSNFSDRQTGIGANQPRVVLGGDQFAQNTLGMKRGDSLATSSGDVGMKQTLSRPRGNSMVLQLDDLNSARNALIASEVFGKPLALRKR